VFANNVQSERIENRSNLDLIVVVVVVAVAY